MRGMNDTFAQKNARPEGQANHVDNQENNCFQKSKIMRKKLTIRAQKSANPERLPPLLPELPPAGAGSDGCGVFHCAKRTVVFWVSGTLSPG